MSYFYKLLIIYSLLISTKLFAAKVKNTEVDVCFTPGENCTQLIVNEINNAKKTLNVQAYSFTSAPIAKALLNAHKRGVDVKVILDKSQFKRKYSSARFFQNNGVPIWKDKKVAIAHNKVMIIDNKLVITGSFNFTKAAQEKNSENLLILRSEVIAKLYQENWKKRCLISKLQKKKIKENPNKKSEQIKNADSGYESEARL